METRGYIYLIRNLVNGKGYIGKTEKTIAWRFTRHKFEANRNSRYALDAAMRKYGVHNFSVIEIASCEPHELNSLEKHFIAAYETFAPFGKGYNLTHGGEGQTGLIHSKETKAKLSAITKAHLEKNGHPMKGRTHSEDAIEKMRASRKGQPSPQKGKKFGPQSPETIAKRSNSLKGRKVSDETQAKLSASNRGKTRSAETRAKLVESHKGKTATNKTKSRMSAARKGKKREPFSDEWKARISAGKKRQYALMREQVQSAHIN